MGGPSGPSFLIYRDIHTILLSFTAIPPSASYLGSSLQREPDPLKGSITFAVQLCYIPSLRTIFPQTGDVAVSRGLLVAIHILSLTTFDSSFSEGAKKMHYKAVILPR